MPKNDVSDSMRDAQPALYDASVMIKPNHAPPNVPDTDEIEELESENRKHLENKMKDPKCIKNVSISCPTITIMRTY